MQILNDVKQLTKFADECGLQGCLADSSFLYGFSFDDDRVHNRANEIFEWIAEKEVPVYANVISRMEFVDLIFRKQVTLGAIKFFSRVDPATKHRDAYNFLKNIRDKNTEARRKNKSFKINEYQLKELRKKLEAATDGSWKSFCKKYIGELLSNEWSILEDDLGLNFIEILENETSDFFETPLLWSDMVNVMGKYGLRGPDAMILNFFKKSKLSLLITGDKDFEIEAINNSESKVTKAVYLL